ncbi:regulator of G-protein signaling 14 isoform X2 [Rhinatrema bivittatum]|uniref:regulator of G-protein signaling 14 isoform X2 n=1 Tax=Rhinatrema bivittatum TaxID=194408 RepID=UPI00112EB722|nr:regulator of G-protein signaling 14 isoform X2 [Rhinatrema bivittatum]
MKSIGVPNGGMMLAASDGELNSLEGDGRGSDQSLNSLPSDHTRGLASERPVASWAVSFERLLQDPTGVKYFTEFLRKEFSAENISFWEACERFQRIPAADSQQLSQECHRIYDVFLSSTSCSPVNIDCQATLTEEGLRTPTPDMFRLQQLQVFNLMKYDSYSRFVKSQLYLQCILAEVDGRPLPELSLPHTDGPSDVSKKKLKSGKALGAETLGRSAKPTRRSFRKRERREMWTDTSEGECLLSPRRESQGSLSSAASMELGFLSSLNTKCENDGVSLRGKEPETGIQEMKYCCIYLPDGTASLTAVRPGLTIREMLLGICQKRGFSLTDVKVHLVGKEQKALALDQESMVLADEEVKLENRISFELEILPIKKTIRIIAKSTKSLHQALQPVVRKYGLDMQQALLRLSGESRALNQDISVSAVATQRLILETKSETRMDDVCITAEKPIQQQSQRDSNPVNHEEAGKPQISSMGSAGGDDCLLNSPVFARSRGTPPRKNLSHRQTTDIEGLVELLNRVQSCRADDQRGLLSKKDLILPDFLQLPGQVECAGASSEMQKADPFSILSPSAPARTMNPSSCCLCSSLMLADQCHHTSQV